ncbi:MAG TPA: CusA/CzcA family heavy metal efflux RND transporter [Candidatus Limnocylindrales bacterium]|nr:CusA/CzcA family heavy metal efflux RND transporter [Candidatus Limnocylindrales bacterium]
MTTEKLFAQDRTSLLERVLAFSVRRRWLVLALTAAALVLGMRDLLRLPIDAVPDLTGVQVQINTEAPGFSPLEVEQQITFPIETAMSGLPGLDRTRSLTRYALSQVTVMFSDDIDMYFARQLIAQRLAEVGSQLPEGIEPQMGPIATGLGDISKFVVEAAPGARKPDGRPYSLTDLRTILDWSIKPRLRLVPGVTEVNAMGGDVEELHVVPDPVRLLARGLSFDDVTEALQRNNTSVGAGYLETRGEQLVVRSPGRLTSLAEISEVVLRTEKDVPVYLRDVADVVHATELRTGAATAGGAETVLGTAVMLYARNSREVARRVREELERIGASLPPGVRVRMVYDRTLLVDRTVATVTRSLLEGALLVIVVLLALLGEWRAAMVTAAVIPLAMLMTVTGMVEAGVSGNLMSLGALDFGLIVDGAVIVVENCVRRVSQRQHELGRALTLQERLAVVFDATREVRRATMFGELIIMIVYVPVLSLGGLEGKMFFPMAFTVLCALAAAMVLSLTFVPAAVAILMRGRVRERESVLVRAAAAVYAPVLRWTLAHRLITFACGFAAVLLALALASTLGREFAPTLDEGDLLIHALRPTATSLSQAASMQQRLEERLAEVPEVEQVFSAIGTADIATDPMPPNVADTFVILKARDLWPDPRKSRDALVEEIEEHIADLPGQIYEFTQPIQMRFNELVAGVRTDVAVKVFGDDNELLREAAQRIESLLASVEGAADVRAEPVSGLPTMAVVPDRAALARYGLDVADVQNVVEIAVGGKRVGHVYRGDRRVALVVRASEDVRGNVDAIARLPVPAHTAEAPPLRAGQLEPPSSGSHGFVPLAQVADITVAEGANQISRENGMRRVVVTANVRGRDLGSFVEDAQRRLDRDIVLPTGYWMDWGGQFEHLLSATARLRIVVPLALALIFALLLVSLHDVRDASLVMTGVPMALTGGVAALWLRDIPLSISAAVGFIALSGVAVLNGLVMLTFMAQLRRGGAGVVDAAREGAMTRLRPVLMTALVAALGFVPMALATGTGSEVQRPLATVVIGGIVSSTLLTLLVLPGLYVMLHGSDEGSARGEGASVSG